MLRFASVAQQSSTDSPGTKYLEHCNTFAVILLNYLYYLYVFYYFIHTLHGLLPISSLKMEITAVLKPCIALSCICFQLRHNNARRLFVFILMFSKICLFSWLLLVFWFDPHVQFPLCCCCCWFCSCILFVSRYGQKLHTPFHWKILLFWSVLSNCSFDWNYKNGKFWCCSLNSLFW